MYYFAGDYVCKSNAFQLNGYLLLKSTGFDLQFNIRQILSVECKAFAVYQCCIGLSKKKAFRFILFL